MKKLLLATFAFSIVVPVLAQGDYSSRLRDQADQVRRASARLAERASQDLMRNSSNSRNDIQAAMLAQQVDAVAAMCLDMVRNRRPVAELRDVVSELESLVRRGPSGSMWRDVQTEVSAFNRELSGGFGFGGSSSRPVIGRVSWRGRVDDRIHLVIRERSIETKTVSGAPQREGTFNFTSALPASPVEVGVTKTSGRGTVSVLQQPSRMNDFTAVIEIYDSGGGAQEYRLDIFWR